MYLHGSCKTQRQTNPQQTNIMKAINAPQVAYRAAIHNQIFASSYFHVSKYVPGKRPGSWKFESSWGFRGHGGALGMTGREANAAAAEANAEAGWTAESPNRPAWM